MDSATALTYPNASRMLLVSLLTQHHDAAVPPLTLARPSACQESPWALLGGARLHGIGRFTRTSGATPRDERTQIFIHSRLPLGQREQHVINGREESEMALSQAPLAHHHPVTFHHVFATGLQGQQRVAQLEASGEPPPCWFRALLGAQDALASLAGFASRCFEDSTKLKADGSQSARCVSSACLTGRLQNGPRRACTLAPSAHPRWLETLPCLQCAQCTPAFPCSRRLQGCARGGDTHGLREGGRRVGRVSHCL